MVLLQQEAAERWPDTFAGVWPEGFRPGETFIVVVAFTRNASENAEELKAGFPYPELISPRKVALSQRSLFALVDRIARERDDLRRGQPPASTPARIRATNGQFSVSEHGPLNRVLIYHGNGQDRDLESEFRQQYGPRVDLAPAIEPACHTRTDCYPNMRGGIYQQSDTSACTTGFSVYGPASGRRFYLTAAHCGGTTRYHQNIVYGTLDREVQAGAIDAERIVRTNNNWTELGQVWVSSSDQRAITSYINWGGISYNEYIGKSGNTTGTTRGYVYSTDVRPSYVTNSFHFVGATACANPGDSGGSVFRNNTAYGIVSGGGTAPCTNPDNDPEDIMVFGVIGEALTELSVELIGTTEPPPTTTTTAPTTTTACLVRNPFTGQCIL